MGYVVSGSVEYCWSNNAVWLVRAEERPQQAADIFWLRGRTPPPGNNCLIKLSWTDGAIPRSCDNAFKTFHNVFLLFLPPSPFSRNDSCKWFGIFEAQEEWKLPFVTVQIWLWSEKKKRRQVSRKEVRACREVGYLQNYANFTRGGAWETEKEPKSRITDPRSGRALEPSFLIM